jgi:heme oxygenase
MAMSAVSLLRSRTAAAHEVVDAAFGRFDLHDPTDYRRFLTAHGRALPVAEARAAAVWPGLRRRTPLLTADLAALGMPTDLIVSTEAGAGPAQFGALYVVEGSRLGGGMLAGRVGDGLPHAYLTATHAPGEWRAIRAAIDAAASGRDEAWHEALVTGALDTFAIYAAAAVAQVDPV